LPPEGVGIIEHDAYYRDRQDLSFEERCQLNFDHPESLETELLVEQIIALKAGSGSPSRSTTSRPTAAPTSRAGSRPSRS
jgi:uridine kinase